MGYDLHITRAESWAENEGLEISAQEWHDYISRDGELRIDADNADMVLWNGKSQYSEPWFAYRMGEIYTKNPDKPMIVKMCKIAVSLNARVQGDDGELYFLRGDDDYFSPT